MARFRQGSAALPEGADPSLRRRVTRSGQILVMFAMSTGLLFGIMAVVVDVGNLWNASLHVQHAAEAAARRAIALAETLVETGMPSYLIGLSQAGS